MNLIKKLLVAYCYFLTGMYVTFGFLKLTGAKIDVLMQKYFSLLWYANVSDLRELAAFFTIAFVMGCTGYLMDRKSWVGYVVGIVLCVLEMVYAKMFYWDVLHSAFWAWQHFLMYIPLIWILIKLIKTRKEAI